jgi:hypothetical protein
VLVYVADEYPAAYARVGTLEAGVVGFNGVVEILSGWVQVGCARLCGVHRSSLWAGPGVFHHPLGHFFIRHLNPPTSFGYLEALEAGDLVEYTVGELGFWTIVAAVAKRSELAAMLAELYAQIVERC